MCALEHKRLFRARDDHHEQQMMMATVLLPLLVPSAAAPWHPSGWPGAVTQHESGDGPLPPPPPPPPPPLPAFRFATVYSDHMVLQRAPSQASIWGYATPGASVSVKAGAASAAAPVTAAADGIWRVSLPPQPASTSAVVLSASSGGKTISVVDVLFGDVWVCSGQSNSACDGSLLIAKDAAFDGAGLSH
jgi:hypothetical protein